MTSSRPATPARVLLALACWLALLAPAGTGPPAAVAERPGALAAGPVAGADQGLVRDRPDGSPVAAGTRRDDRQRSGLELAGPLSAALATGLARTAATGRRGAPPARRRQTAAAGPRAPPALRPAPS
ncbi:MAG TPA: hypothetical protein VFC13_07090 [Actinomycetes bacterium]|jgi:hypothetical protein|nr:hypothetical protein [Actinomycetes bacterium]